MSDIEKYKGVLREDGSEADAGCDPVPGSARPIDLEYFGEHGHVSITDAENFHIIIMRHHGITDPDEVVADWNRRDPDAPWGSGKVGKYVREITDLVCEFMADKIREAGGPSVS
jgi:hypothetical protein